MAKIDKHIEIVSTSVGAVNSLSKKSYNMIYTALSKYYTQVGISLVDNEDDLELLVQKHPDLVFLGVKRIAKTNNGDGETEYIWMSDFLESKHIPYTGSTTSAHRLDHSKEKAKALVKDAGLSTSDYFITSKGEITDASQVVLDFPLFVKPPHLGGGLGVGADSIVRNFDELIGKVTSLNDEYQSTALVEEYLTGREFTVAILQTADRSYLQALPIEMLPEQDAQGDRVIGHEMKSSDVETPVSFVAEGVVKESVMDLAKSVFIAIGARDYGRIDIRLDKHNNPCFLEANLIPSIINGSGNFQKACLINIDLDYEQMLLHIVDLALTRTPLVDEKALALAMSDDVQTA